MSPIPRPTTQEEFWFWMAIKIRPCDNSDDNWFEVSNYGMADDHDWYVLYPDHPTDETKRVRVEKGTHAFWIPIDPRYHYTQNRELLGLRDEYRGTPETWTLSPFELQ